MITKYKFICVCCSVCPLWVSYGYAGREVIITSEKPGHQNFEPKPGHQNFEPKPGHQNLKPKTGHQNFEPKTGHQKPRKAEKGKENAKLRMALLTWHPLF